MYIASSEDNRDNFCDGPFYVHICSLLLVKYLQQITHKYTYTKENESCIDSGWFLSSTAWVLSADARGPLLYL